MGHICPVKLSPRNGLQHRVIDVPTVHDRLVRIVLMQCTNKRQRFIVILRMLI